KIVTALEYRHQVLLGREMEDCASRLKTRQLVGQIGPQRPMARMAATARANDGVLAMAGVVKETHPAPAAARALPARRSDQGCHRENIVLLQPPDIAERGSPASFPVAANDPMQSHRVGSACPRPEGQR